MNAMGLKAKLLAGFGVPAVMVVILGVVSTFGVNNMRDTERWVAHTYGVLETASEILAGAVDMETGMRGYLLAGREAFLEPFNRGNEQTFSLIASLKRTVNDNPAQVERLTDIERTLQGWKTDVADKNIAFRRTVGSGNTMDEMGATIAEARGKAYFDKFRQLMAEFSNEEKRLLDIRSKEQESVVATVEATVLGLIATVILTSVGLGIFISGYVLKQVGGEPSEVAGVADRIASGDLSMKFGSGQRATGIYGAIQGMASAMAEVAGSIRKSSDSVSSSLSEISSAIATQASSVSQQAAAVTETTTSLDGIRATSNQTLEKAEAMSDASARTRQEGERGEEILHRAIAAMEAIRAKVDVIAKSNMALSDQTKQIGEVTAVVNNLAQQSKMLSINASIEASKAGEAGKGFAVVAEEIGNLAAQSDESTDQVRGILEDILRATERAVMATEEGAKEVDRGIALVEQTGDVMQNLNEVISETGGASQIIVAAVRQEVAGINQIANAMKEIQQITGQFVGASEKTKQASAEMEKLVADLVASVDVYKI